MISIEISLDNNSRVYAIDCHGHAEMAGDGEYDLVCASVSIIVQSAYLGIKEHLHRKVNFHRASGDFQMMLQDEPDELTETIFRTMILGVENVALQYPGVVRITKVGGE
jgi:uncharacterized protein YsxB (DUF464 family)